LDANARITKGYNVSKKEEDFTNIKTNKIYAQMCECGRACKDRRDKNGKTMCALCYTGYSVEDLNRLWGAPIQGYHKE